jgi:RNA polymerase subunit RPABC4/transcription elongation factor Spt4
MPTIFDRIKDGADRAAFEADRLRRLQQAQSPLKALKRDVQQATDQLGAATLRLYDEGQLSQPELQQLCQEIDALREKVTAREQEIERIRLERPPERLAPALYGHICPNCRIELPADARFCPRCGGPAADVAPPTPEPAARCAACGEPILPGARFCPACGAPQAPAPEEPGEESASPEPEAILAGSDEGDAVGGAETPPEAEEQDEMPFTASCTEVK